MENNTEQPTAPVNTAQPPMQNQQNTPQPQSAVQNPPPTTTSQLPANPAPVQGNPVKNNNKKIIVIILFTLFVLLIIGVSVYALFGKPMHVATHSNAITTNNTKPLQPPKPTNPPGPFKYGSASVDNINLKVDNVIRNAPVQGPPPDSDKQYLEIDFSVTYMGTTTGIMPGVFYYQASSSSGELIPTTDTNLAEAPGKKVSIPNKLELYGVPLVKGNTIHNAYLLYQIPTGDQGKLLWINSQNKDKNKQRVIFTLF